MSETPAGKGTLYLIPVDLGGGDASSLLSGATLEVARRLNVFIAENPKSARRFLKAAGHSGPLRDISIHLLDEHSGERAVADGLKRLLAGEDCGLLSEAGCPAVADPGAALVRRAHEAGVRVVPLAGPSSILLALMASGMDGQHFTFNGYLPVDRAQRASRLRELEARSSAATQIFIETPYRCAAMLDTLLETCRGDTLLCIAADLTLPEESVATRAIAAWKEQPPDLTRRLVVFLLFRERN